MIRAHDLTHRYGRVDALKAITLRVPQGSAYAIIGANGAGKTTLIKILLNLLRPSSGEALVLGTETRRLGPAQLAQIGYVSENQQLPRALLARRFLDYLRPMYPTWDPALESDLCQRFRLPLDRHVGALSHGTRVKLALVAALSYRPRLVVLDEPFTGLDALVRDELMEGLTERAAETTILVSSHDLDDIESLVTHVAFIDDGHLLLEGSLEQIRDTARAVSVSLDAVANIAARSIPACWIATIQDGDAFSFVDLQYSDLEYEQRLQSILGPTRGVHVRPLSLRELFLALARSRTPATRWDVA